MGISLSLESKSGVDLSMEDKANDITWDDATWTWDEATGTWARPGLVLSKESKSAVSLSLESK
jgi:hypothetical protein